jgi:hypothetical protein
VIRVRETRKISLLKLKKILATAGLILSMGLAAIPSVPVYAEEEVLFEDTSSDDVNLEDADSNGVEQTNGDTKVKKEKEKVNDGSVDTSKDTNPKDAKKDEYNGDNNDYFDSYDKSKDSDPNGGEYIDSDDEYTRKHPPVPKTGDNPWMPVAGVGGITAALIALYEIRKKLSFMKNLNVDAKALKKVK